MSPITEQEESLSAPSFYRRPYFHPPMRRIPPGSDPSSGPDSVWAVSHPPHMDLRQPTQPTKVEKSLFPPSSPLPLIFNMTLEQRRAVAKGLALYVLQAEGFRWHYYGNIVHDKKHLYSLRKKFFKIFASFALHIFDIEDFVRAIEKPIIRNNVMDFCEDLKKKYGNGNGNGGDNQLDSLVSGAMAYISTGNMEITEKYPSLWQQDVDFILGCYRNKSHHYLNSVLTDVAFTFHKKITTPLANYNLHEHYVTTALEVLKAHVPLPEEEKSDLRLNAHKERHVLRQALYLEAWKDFHKEDLEKLCLREHGAHCEEVFITSFHGTLNYLAAMKARLTSFVKGMFCNLTESSTLGNFNKEVVEAVWIANCERMRLGYRLLSTDQLLFGLSRSRVADKVKVFENAMIPTPEVRDFSRTNLLYYILRLSCEAASNLGLDEIQLEHLYLATKFASRLLPTKRRRTDDGSEQVIDWNSVFEQGAVTDFLRGTSATEPEGQSLGEISKEALWGHFFFWDREKPFGPRLMFETLVGEFKEKNFKPLEKCSSIHNFKSQNFNNTTDDEVQSDEEEYCHMYSQFSFTPYD